MEGVGSTVAAFTVAGDFGEATVSTEADMRFGAAVNSVADTNSAAAMDWGTVIGMIVAGAEEST